jgi:histidinol-phosphate aminotransferase
MPAGMNRRDWLKVGAWSAAGFALGMESLSCRPGTTEESLRALDPQGLKLNSNESPYGISPLARQAHLEAVERAHLYPHRDYPDLIENIAERERTSPESIILGAGSTEIMTMLIRLAGSGSKILAADPTYFDFVYYARQAGCPLQAVPTTEDHRHDLKGMASRLTPDIRMVYICNPLNPTGTIVPREKLEAFCEEISARALVVVDEAYFDYVEDESYGSMLPLIRRGRNVAVTRTFSKIHGMAGLRVGFGIAPPDIIEALQPLKSNFASLAFPSLRAAQAAYSDQNFAGRVKRENSRTRAFVMSELERMGLYCIPSHTNFVLFAIPGDAEETRLALAQRGVQVRAFSFRDRSWIRVSLGSRDQMQSFMTHLKAVL